MKLARRDRISAEINLGTFADIVFLIIIFFVLTTTLIKPAYEKLNIPAGTSDPEKKDQKQLTININAEGIRYGEKGRKVTVDELRSLINARLKNAEKESDKIVILDSSGDVNFGRYYEVAMIVDRAGGVLALIDHEDGKGKKK